MNSSNLAEQITTEEKRGEHGVGHGKGMLGRIKYGKTHEVGFFEVGSSWGTNGTIVETWRLV